MNSKSFIETTDNLSQERDKYKLSESDYHCSLAYLLSVILSSNYLGCEDIEDVLSLSSTESLELMYQRADFLKTEAYHARFDDKSDNSD